MDESEAVDQESAEVATPIFSVYRRGYDPEQVDRYVADQQRRLDEALHRASESERKLAAAVGQLRELHRRVAVYESEQRTTQPPALDTLGERVQRILQEAWEGAYNLRQEAEREVTDLREQTQREVDELRGQTQREVDELRGHTLREVEAQREQVAQEVEELRQIASREAAELVDEATRRALALRDEMDRRRQAYLERVERDRQRAVAQITYLYDQRQLAISELARLQATVQATIEEMVHSPLGKPVAAVVDAASRQGPAPQPGDEDDGETDAGDVAASAVLDVDASAGEAGGVADEMRVAGDAAGEADLAHGVDANGEASADIAAGAEAAGAESADVGTRADAPGNDVLAEPVEPSADASGLVEPGTDTQAVYDIEPHASSDTVDPGQSLFSAIIKEKPAGHRAEAVADGWSEDLTLAVAHDLESEAAQSGILHPEEVPTGPMEALEYGYGHPYREGYTNGMVAESGEEAQPTVAERPRSYGGVYDAEADGWS